MVVMGNDVAWWIGREMTGVTNAKVDSSGGPVLVVIFVWELVPQKKCVTYG